MDRPESSMSERIGAGPELLPARMDYGELLPDAMDPGERRLNELGYKQELRRSMVDCV